MLEPKTPVNVKVRYTPYPAVVLPKGGGVPSRKHFVVLRHRHLRQMHTIIPASRVATGSAVARPTAGREVELLSPPPSVRLSSAVAANAAPPHRAPPQNSVSDAAATNAGPSFSSPFQAIAESPPSATSSAAHHEPRPTVEEGEYKIRDTAEKTRWFSSRAPHYLLEPPSISHASLGYVYVHITANDDRQLWLFTRAGCWEKIHLRHPHPYLAGYVLRLLSNGEPRWVKRETYVKLVTEARKTAEAASSAASSSSAGRAIVLISMKFKGYPFTSR